MVTMHPEHAYLIGLRWRHVEDSALRAEKSSDSGYLAAPQT
jgi:hypothetical protein